MNLQKALQVFFDENKENEDDSRRYAVAAFRLYALCGQPTYEELRHLIHENAVRKSRDELCWIRSGISKPTEQALINAERLMAQKAPILEDLRAVEQAIVQIERKKNGREILRAVEMIYFAGPGVKLDKGEIARRVLVASLQIPASERQVYYWLKEARLLFCRERGLRI
ncbi:MAG: hypothetical protein LBS36_05305 [Oscillospiraceae bacterium]|jgi:hypothetical protein|nr:hypothetical protein [Oscillospiraceae bacterium]